MPQAPCRPLGGGPKDPTWNLNTSNDSRLCCWQAGVGWGVVFRLDLQRSVLQMLRGGSRHPWWVHVWKKEQVTSKQNLQMALLGRHFEHKAGCSWARFEFRCCVHRVGKVCLLCGGKRDSTLSSASSHTGATALAPPMGVTRCPLSSKTPNKSF